MNETKEYYNFIAALGVITKRRVMQVIHHFKYLLTWLCDVLSDNKTKNVWLIGECGFDTRDMGKTILPKMKTHRKHNPKTSCILKMLRQNELIKKFQYLDVIM